MSQSEMGAGGLHERMRRQGVWAQLDLKTLSASTSQTRGWETGMSGSVLSAQEVSEAPGVRGSWTSPGPHCPSLQGLRRQPPAQAGHDRRPVSSHVLAVL